MMPLASQFVLNKLQDNVNGGLLHIGKVVSHYDEMGESKQT